jgi:hypothetical protein
MTRGLRSGRLDRAEPLANPARAQRGGRLMARLLAQALVLAMLMAMAASTVAAKQTCTSIQSGELQTSEGDTVKTGYDGWGYNYQAHVFNGKYCDAYHDAAWCQSFKDVDLLMKWNDAWLSNKDCDGDGEIDRHHGFASYIGSGAWLTNHQQDTYQLNGTACEWTYFVKVVAAPADAYSTNGVWYAADGTMIGPAIWGDFAIVQHIEEDPCAGLSGRQYVSPYGVGFGRYGPK